MKHRKLASFFAPTSSPRRIAHPASAEPARAWTLLEQAVGNIRELDSTIARAALSATGPVVQASDLEFLELHGSTHASTTPQLASLRDAERAHVARVLEAAEWNKKRAAEILQISRGTLYRKIDEYDLAPVLHAAVPPAD